MSETLALTRPNSVTVAEIRQALDLAGYVDSPATLEALQACFIDYADSGVWSDLDAECAVNVDPAMMARALTKVARRYAG